MGSVLVTEENSYSKNLLVIKKLKIFESVINCNCGIKSAWTSILKHSSILKH